MSSPQSNPYLTSSPSGSAAEAVKLYVWPTVPVVGPDKVGALGGQFATLIVSVLSLFPSFDSVTALLASATALTECEWPQAAVQEKYMIAQYIYAGRRISVLIARKAKA